MNKLPCLVAILSSAGACSDRIVGDACGPRTCFPDGGGGVGTGWRTEYFRQDVTNAVDLLFVLDDGPGGAALQASLSKGFPTLIEVLDAFSAGRPDLHVGVTTTSVGIGAHDVPGCAMGNGGGQLHPARSGCAAAPKDAFVISYDKGTRNNFPESSLGRRTDISDAIACLADVGENGCRFRQPIVAALAAAGLSPVGKRLEGPRVDADFWRREALPVVVLASTVDDCSAATDANLFAPDDTTLGPLSPFRCAAHGHTCAGGPPGPGAGTLVGCHVNDESTWLHPVPSLAAAVATISPTPAWGIIATLTAPPAPYGVVVGADEEPAVAPSCSRDTLAASPGLRLQELTHLLDRDAIDLEICDGAASMDQLGKRIVERLGAQCLEGPLFDSDLSIPGIQAVCKIVDRPGSGLPVELISCDEGANPPCWRILRNTRDCSSGFEFKVDRGAVPAPPLTTTMVTCGVCETPGDPHCPEMSPGDGGASDY